jgi:ribonuclease Z
MFNVTILGNNSAVPAFDRHPTSQVLTTNNELFLIDCGEGTQMQMQLYKIKRSRINHIFISHLHGDHYFGLIGLITSYGLMGRINDLYLYSPPGLQVIVQMQLDVANVVLPYALHFVTITSNTILLQNNKIKVSCFATNHRIACYGFRFDEVKSPRSIDAPKCLQHEIPAAYYTKLQQGENYEKRDGTIVLNEAVTVANTAAKSYAYCADTKYDETILPFIQNVDLLYHETTYLDALQDKATERYHTTTKQAAAIAIQANAKQLLIGHFSSKYSVLDDFATETQSIFANTVLAIEGGVFEV